MILFPTLYIFIKTFYAVVAVPFSMPCHSSSTLIKYCILTAEKFNTGFSLKYCSIQITCRQIYRLLLFYVPVFL